MKMSMRETMVCEAVPRCFAAVVGARISMMVRMGQDPSVISETLNQGRI
jgi:hypothetical protein